LRPQENLKSRITK